MLLHHGELQRLFGPARQRRNGRGGRAAVVLSILGLVGAVAAAAAALFAAIVVAAEQTTAALPSLSLGGCDGGLDKSVHFGLRGGQQVAGDEDLPAVANGLDARGGIDGGAKIVKRTLIIVNVRDCDVPIVGAAAVNSIAVPMAAAGAAAAGLQRNSAALHSPIVGGVDDNAFASRFPNRNESVRGADADAEAIVERCLRHDCPRSSFLSAIHRSCGGCESESVNNSDGAAVCCGTIVVCRSCRACRNGAERG